MFLTGGGLGFFLRASTGDGWGLLGFDARVFEACNDECIESL